jgi:predicted CXXCH cytochrome family protein
MGSDSSVSTPRRSRSLAVFGLSAALLILCGGVALRSSAAPESQAADPPAGAAQPGDKGKAGEKEKAAAAADAADPDSPGKDAEFVGSAFCAAPACHGAMMAPFNKLRHSHYVSDVRFKDAAACEVCHGPGSNHVGDPDHRRIYRFTVRSQTNTRRLEQACMKCHQATIERGHYGSTAHARAGLNCASCHEVHYDLGTPHLLRLPGIGGPAGQPQPASYFKKKKPAAPEPSPPPGAAAVPEAPAAPAADAAPPEPEVNKPKLGAIAQTRVPLPQWRTSFPRQPGLATREQATAELCGSCHRREISEARQFSHHPILEGRVSCTDCHDAHRAEQGRMLTRPTIDETCLKCHEQVRGPFVFEHDPVHKGGLGRSCLECHRAHGSPNRNLQVLFSRGLCIQCHTDIAQEPLHRGRGGDCWRSGCHVAVHGSNSHRFLLRQ